MMKEKTIKRNNLLSYLLFGMTAVFLILYIGYRLFLSDYSVLFDRWFICADVWNGVMIGVCIALLIFRDKRMGTAAKVLLISALLLLPTDRFLMVRMIDASYVVPGTWDTIVYLAAAIVLAVTVCFYIKTAAPKILAVLLFGIVFVIGGFFDLGSYLFSYEKIRDVADIPSPDGIHHVRVLEYADDDNRDWRLKAVFAYNSAESFSIGSIEFQKDWAYISQYNEEDNPHLAFYDDTPLDVNTQITFDDDGTVTIQEKTYTYDGEPVSEPPEPPL